MYCTTNVSLQYEHYVHCNCNSKLLFITIRSFCFSLQFEASVCCSAVLCCRYLYTDEVRLFADQRAATANRTDGDNEPHTSSSSSSRCPCPHCISPTGSGGSNSDSTSSNQSPRGVGGGGGGGGSAAAAAALAVASDLHVRRMRQLVDVLYAAHKYLVRPVIEAAVGALAQMLCAHTAAPILALSFMFEVFHMPYMSSNCCLLLSHTHLREQKCISS